MKEDPYQINRHDLYQLVWDVPMAQLARKFRMSDVGLAKICKKYDIPRPPRGYWAKKSAGIRTEKLSLPHKDKNDVITIYPIRDDDQDSFNAYLEEKSLLEDDIGKINVAKRLSNPHPLVEQTATILNQATPDQHGLLKIKSQQCLNIIVSKKQLSRALRIMDSLLKHLNELGFDVSIRGGDSIVNIDDIEVEIGIREELKTEFKAPELDVKEYYHFRHSRDNQIRVPSGNLCLSVLNFYSSDNLRKNWRDTQKKTLEEQLGKFMEGLMRLVAKQKEIIRLREEHQRQELERQKSLQEQKKRQEELQAQIAQECTRVDGLIQDAENWKKSKVLKEFIAAVESARESGKCAYDPDGTWEEWFQWARDQADRLDPLAPSPPSIIDKKFND